MSHKKHAPKRKHVARAVPLLGVAGVSLALVGDASARTSASGVDAPSGDTAPRHEITLNELDWSSFRTILRRSSYGIRSFPWAGCHPSP
jgi:hypothetical protein